MSSNHPIPGLRRETLRRSDLPALTALARASLAADGGLPFLFEPESLLELFLPDRRMEAQAVWTPGGALAACASVSLVGEKTPRRAVILGHVHPDWRGRGLGTALLAWSRGKAEAFFEGMPPDSRVLQIRNESLSDAAERLYQKNGFTKSFEERVLRRELDRALPQTLLPQGLTLTEWQPDLAEAFYRAYRESFRTRPGFPGWSQAEWLESWVDQDTRPGWSLLARREEEPLGFVTAADAAPHGYIVQLGVVKSARGSGLASALMLESMRRMQADGIPAALLTVNVNNPNARGLFSKMGFKEFGRRARYELTG
jgi:mycothiol synthase